ncbi:hypothetical protein FACS1894151_02100 [Spirochaetia bacterium]|nr:hypothetical protein FACS1894151_02100 [Spirochaetia bacterium]
MAKCFIIQPFDNGKYDKRFKDTYKPAIEKCGLEAYRVDKDPRSQIPIDDIDLQIRNSDICLADITEDNPNVWFEIGLAIAYGKDMVLICSNERDGHFPFDIQHRSIIKYTTDSPSDFDVLKEKIIEKVKALLQVQQTQKTAMPLNPLRMTNGLESYETTILVEIATNINNPNDGVSIYRLKKILNEQGVTNIGITLGLKKLSTIDFVEFSIEDDRDGEEYYVYKITDKGMNWLMDNKSQFVLENKEPSDKRNESSDEKNEVIDDIPF